MKRKPFIVCNDHARIPVGAEVLCREEGKTSAQTDAADPSSLVRCADCLRGILDHGELMACRDGKDCIHVSRKPKKVNGHDHLGLWCDRTLDAGRVDIER